ncbi:DNA topoisomerase IV subunit A [Spirochaetota bacterium]
MAYIKKLFDENFLHYASYVIKDRAIPELDDGLKPVQRRILHTLLEADDGKFHKVANIVGSVMKYHPHGDASIYSALVVLANKDLFIDKQGNYGNLLTGDEASAARYIECRISQFAKEVFYNPKITEYADSYDGRNREPVVFPAKLPVIAITGAEGIAVGMSTKILPHNPLEVIAAEIACLKGQKFRLDPDFPGGGIADTADYEDGLGKVRVRASLDTSDPKRIVIKDLPYGVTTESLAESIEAAAKSGRLKIASINDFTTDKVEIEIKLARGVYSKETVDALYAFTQCEQSISCNLLVIRDGQPALMTLTEVIEYHAKHLLTVLKAELELSIRELLDEQHARTLERIFIEERVYKQIENKKTQQAVEKAVTGGLLPFSKEIKREVRPEDVERLLRIPIRRISLYDIEKARAEMERIKAKLKEERYHLAHLTEYGIAFLEGLSKKLGPEWKRKTRIASFDMVDAREAAKRDIPLRYDRDSGYLGTVLSGGENILSASPFDKLLIMRRTGTYSVVPLPERLFVDKGMLFAGIADKEELADKIFSIVYTDPKSDLPYIKRFTIDGWIMNKDYLPVPEGARVIYFTADSKKRFFVKYAAKPRFKIEEERFRVDTYPVKGLKTLGIRLSGRTALDAWEEGEQDLPAEQPSGLKDKDKSAEKPVKEAAKKKAEKKEAVKSKAAKTDSKATKPEPKKTTEKAVPAKKTETKSPASAKKPKEKSKKAKEPAKSDKKEAGSAKGKQKDNLKKEEDLAKQSLLEKAKVRRKS